MESKFLKSLYEGSTECEKQFKEFTDALVNREKWALQRKYLTVLLTVY